MNVREAKSERLPPTRRRAFATIGVVTACIVWRALVGASPSEAERKRRALAELPAARFSASSSDVTTYVRWLSEDYLKARKRGAELLGRSTVVTTEDRQLLDEVASEQTAEGVHLERTEDSRLRFCAPPFGWMDATAEVVRRRCFLCSMDRLFLVRSLTAEAIVVDLVPLTRHQAEETRGEVREGWTMRLLTQ